MTPRLARPLLAVLITGAVAVGGAVYAVPASAAGPVSAVPVLAEDPVPPPPPPADPDPAETAPATTPAPDPSGSSLPPVPEVTQTTTPPAPEESRTTTPPAPEQSRTTTPPPADTTAPRGSFTLNTGTLLVGQRVVFTQGAVADDRGGAVTRQVSWGDGSTSTLAPGQKITKVYNNPGRFRVTFTLTDAAKNSAGVSRVLSVVVPGRYSFSRTTLWPGQNQYISITGLPADTMKLVIDTGDGYRSSFPGPFRQNIRFRNYYYFTADDVPVTGRVHIKVAVLDKLGWSRWVTIGSAYVLADNWAPVVKITKPKSPERARSWKVVTGTAYDKGSGAYIAAVWPERNHGKKWYCLNAGKKWQRYYDDAGFGRICRPLLVPVVNGKWKASIPAGLRKGERFFVDVSAWDRIENQSAWRTRSAKITRS